MNDLNSQSLFEEDQPPHEEPIYFHLFNNDTKGPKQQQSEEEFWSLLNQFWYGRPVTKSPLRDLMTKHLKENKPDQRKEKSGRRPGTYRVYASIKEYVVVLDKSKRTIERMVAETRKALGYKPYTKITVEEFCNENNLPEEEIQKSLHELSTGNWNKSKNKYKKDKED